MPNYLDKYKPKGLDEIIGNKSEIQRINTFVKQFNTRKNIDSTPNPNLIISGPIGIGKTIMVDLILKANHFDKVTTNLSDIYCKKTKTDAGNITRSVETYYNMLRQKKNLCMLGSTEFNKVALVFDDISNISNPKKKDAVKALIKRNNKDKKFPIIIIANNKHNKLVGELRKMVTYTIKGKPPPFNKVTNEVVLKVPQNRDIREFVEKICAKEGINFLQKKADDDDIYDLLVDHSQYDIRRLINMLEELKQMYDTKNITVELFEEYMETSKKKDSDPGIFEGTRILLNRYNGIDNALSVYREDRTTIPLIFHENYPANISYQYPKLSVDKQVDILVDVSKNISESDKVDGLIYSNQYWSLQPAHGFYSCVLPSYIINKTPGKMFKHEQYAYTKDYNKTSIKKINKKVIKKTRENTLLKKMSINDFLFMCTILKTLILRKDVDSICNLLRPYKFTYLKEIESIISIDKLEKGADNEKLKTKYKIKGKMKTIMMENLGLREEDKNKKKGAKGKVVRSGSKTATKAGPRAKGPALKVTNVKRVAKSVKGAKAKSKVVTEKS